MTPHKVLFFDHSSGIGGAENSLLAILQGLDRAIWHPILACPAGELQSRAKRLEIEVIDFRLPRLRRSPRAIRNLFSVTRQIAELAETRQIDLLYANTVRSAVYCSLTPQRTGGRFIWHMRDFWLSEEEPAIHAIDWIGKRWIAYRAAGIFANSRAVGDVLPYQRKLRVIHNGVDLDTFRISGRGQAFRAQFGIPAGALVVGTAGRLRPWKGMDRFLRLAAGVSAQYPDVFFLVVGGNPSGIVDDYPDHLMKLSRELNVSARVIFTGQVEDVRPALEGMDVFVHAGDPEPFGLVNIEAMAMQLPVVAFDHGALPEIVLDGVTGLLAPPGSGDRLVELVLGLLKSPGERNRLGQAGRLRAESLFSVERMVGGISDSMVKLIAG